MDNPETQAIVGTIHRMKKKKTKPQNKENKKEEQHEPPPPKKNPGVNQGVQEKAKHLLFLIHYISQLGSMVYGV